MYFLIKSFIQTQPLWRLLKFVGFFFHHTKWTICGSPVSFDNSKHLTKLFPGNVDLLDSRRHDDVIKWKHFPRYWPSMRVIQRSPVNSPHKGRWRGALMFSLICAWTDSWANNGDAGDLRRYRTHYDVIFKVLFVHGLYIDNPCADFKENDYWSRFVVPRLSPGVKWRKTPMITW